MLAIGVVRLLSSQLPYVNTIRRTNAPSVSSQTFAHKIATIDLQIGLLHTAVAAAVCSGNSRCSQSDVRRISVSVDTCAFDGMRDAYAVDLMLTTSWHFYTVVDGRA